MPHIQDPTIARALQRSLRLTGLPDSILGPEVVPVITVADLTEGEFGDVERAATGMEQVGPVAAEHPHISIRRQNIGTEIIVKSMTLNPGGAAATFIVGALTTGLPAGTTTSVEGSWDDFNTPGRPSALLQRGTVTPAALPAINIMYRINVLGVSTIQFPLNIRLGPPLTAADVLWCHVTGVNVDMQCGFQWVERPQFG